MKKANARDLLCIERQCAKADMSMSCFSSSAATSVGADTLCLASCKWLALHCIMTLKAVVAASRGICTQDLYSFSCVRHLLLLLLLLLQMLGSNVSPWQAPPVAALPFGANSTRYLALELHYNNPDALTGQHDTGSGIR
jgi:hypothetical protein